MGKCEREGSPFCREHCPGRTVPQGRCQATANALQASAARQRELAPSKKRETCVYGQDSLRFLRGKNPLLLAAKRGFFPLKLPHLPQNPLFA